MSVRERAIFSFTFNASKDYYSWPCMPAVSQGHCQQKAKEGSMGAV